MGYGGAGRGLGRLSDVSSMTFVLHFLWINLLFTDVARGVSKHKRTTFIERHSA